MEVVAFLRMSLNASCNHLNGKVCERKHYWSNIVHLYERKTTFAIVGHSSPIQTIAVATVKLKKVDL